MNKIDKDYQNLLQDILDNGVRKNDRTGTGTISVFGRQIRHKMSDGFPLLTTKKMAYKSMIVELLWFLRGDTNIKYLVDNNCNIWNGDCYKKFHTDASDIKDAYMSGDLLGTQTHIESMFSDFDNLIILTKEEFIEKIKTDDEFANIWGYLGNIYGKQWREWSKYDKTLPDCPYDFEYHSSYNGPIDQIQNLINDLKTNPDSRRLMVSAWNVGDIDKMILPPCHYSFQCYTRELTFKERIEYANSLPLRDVNDNLVILSGYPEEIFILDEIFKVPKRKISLKWDQRSVDTFLGLPFNIASYALLLEILSKIVNMVPDELIGNLGDTHLYLNHVDQSKEQIIRDSYELPNLRFSDKFINNVNKYNECYNLDDVKFDFDDLINSLDISDFIIDDYQSHPTIKATLSN